MSDENKNYLTGAQMITAERWRQMEVEGWTPEHDDEHTGGEIAIAAALYATPIGLYKTGKVTKGVPCGCRSAAECGHTWTEDAIFDAWPWDKEWDKRTKHNRIRQLSIAGALAAAEIDRLKRKGQK